ncbi:MAG: hypothetical protein QOK45_1424 [Mycobacterium sp.]|nr:hypothetical protein [Mycobacterium sp.]
MTTACFAASTGNPAAADRHDFKRSTSVRSGDQVFLDLDPVAESFQREDRWYDCVASVRDFGCHGPILP